MAGVRTPPAVGSVIGPMSVTTPLTRLVRWAGASGDFTPIHFDRDYAKGPAALPDIIVHGPLKMALCIRLLTEWAGGDPAAVRRIALRYGSMDVVDSTIEIAATVTAVDESQHSVDVELSLRVDGRESTTGTATIRYGVSG